MQNFTFEGNKSRKKDRIKKLQELKGKINVSASYVCNSEKEEICNLLVNRFISENKDSDFEEFVTVKNEFHVIKCVCLTLKPSLLPYPNLYDANDCAHFVANYFEYEDLEDNCRAPEFLPSPSQVISWRIGDSFDLATVLTSLLLGSSYDAFVVYGVAPEWICKRDLRERDDNVESYIPAESHEFINDANLAIQMMLDGHFCREESNLTNRETTEFIDKKNRSIASSRTGVHSWVLIRPNARSQNVHKTIFFIEPSTGIMFPCDNKVPYLKVFAVWNQYNYWVNLDHYNCTNFDLNSDKYWKYIFYNSSVQQSSDIDDVNKQRQDRFHLPLSWVGQLISLPRSEFQDAMYTPNNCRMYFLRNHKIELHSNFSNTEGLLMRISKFFDKNHWTTESISEHFHYGRSRSDGLLVRVRLPLKNCYYEKFSSRNRHHIVSWIESIGARRVIKFHTESRVDNLIEYHEEFGRTIKHEYEGRRDNLVRRIVYITWIDAMKAKGKDSLVLVSSDSTKNIVVLKVEEHFDHSGKIIDDDAISCRTFHLKDKILELQYNYDKKILRITKDLDTENLNRRQFLLDTEKQITSSVRLLHQEYTDILRTRRRKECPDLTMTKPLQHVKDSSTDSVQMNHEVTVESEQYDFLSPFFMNIKDQSIITKEGAKQIYDSCFESYKSRLIERANIIQLRLDEENEKLISHQKEYNSLSKDPSDDKTRAFEGLCRDTIFKIEILKKRQKEHESTFISKLKAMELKLRNDHRLKALFPES